MSRNFDNEDNARKRVEQLENALRYSRAVIQRYQVAISDPGQHSCSVTVYDERSEPRTLAQQGFCQQPDLTGAVFRIENILSGLPDEYVDNFTAESKITIA